MPISLAVIIMNERTKHSVTYDVPISLAVVIMNKRTKRSVTYDVAIAHYLILTTALDVFPLFTCCRHDIK